MTDEETGTTALMIPALESKTELIEMAVRPAARDHILQWDAGQRLVAIHEASHCIAAAAAPTKVPVRAIDITQRHGGFTMLGGPFEDTSLPWETKARMLDTMMVACAGASGERHVLGEHSDGSSSDYDVAVSIAMRFVKSGFGGPGLFLGEDGLPHMYLTEEWKSRTLARIQELVAEAQVRADALIADHHDALLIVATAVYEHRRLADERLDAVLVSAGFTLPRATA
jgi:ATP-dependent Zn protease